MTGRAGRHPLLPQLQQADIHLTRDDSKGTSPSTPARSGDLCGTCCGKQQLTLSGADVIWCGEKAQELPGLQSSDTVSGGWMESLFQSLLWGHNPVQRCSSSVSDRLVCAQCHFSPPKWPLSKNKQPGNNLKHAPSTQLLGLRQHLQIKPQEYLDFWG